MGGIITFLLQLVFATWLGWLPVSGRIGFDSLLQEALIAPNSIRLQRAPVRLPGKMAKYGSDTRAVLQQLGCTAGEVEQMIEQGVAARQWSLRYLPS